MAYPVSIWLSLSALETGQGFVFIFAISFRMLAFSFFLKVLHIFPTDFSLILTVLDLDVVDSKRSPVYRRSIYKFSGNYKNEI